METKHNPPYLSGTYFNTNLLKLTTDPGEVIRKSDCIVVAIPSAYVTSILLPLDKNIFFEKKVVSAVKGILPEKNQLLNDFLKGEFNFPLENYFSVLGPCHAEEIAEEKLSYLTFSGIDKMATKGIANKFKTRYLNTVENEDIYGVQFAAVLKNIYAVGAGLAHGLDYGDNFLSVLIANSANEMAGFLNKTATKNIEFGQQDSLSLPSNSISNNYAVSVYLGDLLVTCYSLYSRNRTFGKMIGMGHAVKSAQQEMSMVAEGYPASKSIYQINKVIVANMPIAETVYKILWENLSAREGFTQIESILV
jgi:glycerol-3-phosphate dehydrogenase (NAD(P)+)